MGRRNKYNTEEERLEAKRRSQKKYNQENKDKISEKNKKWYSENKVMVQEYYHENKKPLTTKQKARRKEYMEAYREANKNKLIEYRDRNREKISKNSEKWVKDNPEKNREKTYTWRSNNPEKTKLINNKSRSRRRKQDELFRLSCNVRSMLSKVIKRGGYKKNSRSYDILSCDFNALKKHIELLWEDWMSWDNYGLYNGELKYGWDIDHIIPISTAKNEVELLKLNNYKNLQPLCSKINRDIKINKTDF